MQRANASLLIGTSSWKEQFSEALTVSAGKYKSFISKSLEIYSFSWKTGGDEDDEGGDSETASPSCTDYLMHFLTLFWKITFAFIPPTGEYSYTIQVVVWI